MNHNIKRKYPIGAEIIPKKGVHFRVWAPDHKKIILEIKDDFKAKRFPLAKERNGYFSLFLSGAVEGLLYQFFLGEEKKPVADPASRYQPQGPFGPSSIVNPKFAWTDQSWKGIKIEEQIIYEMHIGTFTQEGTFAAAKEQLPYLADLGITTLEIMPLNEFPNDFGWGYDGVNLFAPYHVYGAPHELKDFINEAHRLKLGVILDVVYNHLGPTGNHLFKFAKSYTNNEEVTEWGDAINFDFPEVTAFFLTNARYWIEEFHFDGLRIDASSTMFCNTKPHILELISRTVRKAAGKKKVVIIAENEPQNTKLVQTYQEGGYGLDSLWNDDFHHTAIVRLIGQREAYCKDYLGSPQEFISCMKFGFLYQGQYYSWQKQRRGVQNLHLPHSAFITFLENHDQVANLGYGKRLHQLTHPGDLRAMTCLLLLGVSVPMLFQGQEFASSHPFYYFADHNEEVNALIDSGRKEFLAQFPNFATKEAQREMLNPSDPLNFVACKLDFAEKEKNKHILLLHKDLITLRRSDSVFKKMNSVSVEGSVVGENGFLLRYFGKNLEDNRLLLFNFGLDILFESVPDPLIAPGEGLEWELIWSSESVIYGGKGTEKFHHSYWKIPAHSATVFKARRTL